MNDVIEKYIEKYPELTSMFDSVVFIPSSLYERYKNDNRIICDEIEISELFLVDIIYSPYYERVLNKLFKSEIDSLKIAYLEDDELCMESLTKVDIVRYSECLLSQTRINLPNEFKRKCNKLKFSISYDALKRNEKDKIYTIEIDKQEYNISVNDMLLFMQMNPDKLKQICNNPTYKTIGNIRKTYFFYAVYKFFTTKEIYKNYYLTEDVIQNYKSLINLEMIDFEAVNKFYNYDDGVNRIKLNEELEREILKNLPKNFNKIESAIYIYIKMCKLLSYDEEFFFAHQETEVLEKHRSIDHLLVVSPTSNEVVCYEFNAIYAKLLKDLHVNFCSNRPINECYGTNNHMMLDFRCGKYLVSADSLTSIFNGDIINVKLKQPIKGLKCENKNEQTKEAFSKLVNRVYDIVNSEEETKKYNLRDFDDSNVVDKLLILMEKINFKKYIGMDFIAYALKLYKGLFNEEERLNNIKVSVVTGYKGKIHGGLIFCVNTKGFNVGEENVYYLFDTRRNIKILNRLELQDMFDEGVVDYFSDLRYDLPGIKRVLKK